MPLERRGHHNHHRQQYTSGRSAPSQSLPRDPQDEFFRNTDSVRKDFKPWASETHANFGAHHQAYMSDGADKMDFVSTSRLLDSMDLTVLLSEMQKSRTRMQEL